MRVQQGPRNASGLNGIRTVPVVLSHSSPPLQPPSRQELGPGLTLKSQSRRPFEFYTVRSRPTMYNDRRCSTQMRPAVQLSGTSNVTEVEGAASQLSKIHSR